MASQLDMAMEMLLSVFYKYSSKEGDKYKLSKKELLQNELGVRLENPRDPEELDKIMRDLDKNGDMEASYQEFAMLLATVFITINRSPSE